MPEQGDMLLWKNASAGSFSVKDAYLVMAKDYESVDTFFYGQLWKLCIPRIVAVFIWRLSLNRVPTTDNLYKRQLIICRVEIDSISSTLFSCKFAALVWNHSLLLEILVFNIASLIWVLEKININKNAMSYS
ncbi:hypothetical protein GmHk_18G051786 [Glycine max]|nr:hypothetical protein GmHk_18G051786 [Glycine max]